MKTRPQESRPDIRAPRVTPAIRRLAPPSFSTISCCTIDSNDDCVVLHRHLPLLFIVIKTHRFLRSDASSFSVVLQNVDLSKRKTIYYAAMESRKRERSNFVRHFSCESFDSSLACRLSEGATNARVYDTVIFT